MSVAVELRHISKRFPGVIANKDVSMSGNRDGSYSRRKRCRKSTVMKILYGMQRPDSGEIFSNTRPCISKSNDAIDAYRDGAPTLYVGR